MKVLKIKDVFNYFMHCFAIIVSYSKTLFGIVLYVINDLQKGEESLLTNQSSYTTKH